MFQIGGMLLILVRVEGQVLIEEQINQIRIQQREMVQLEELRVLKIVTQEIVTQEIAILDLLGQEVMLPRERVVQREDPVHLQVEEALIRHQEVVLVHLALAEVPLEEVLQVGQAEAEEEIN